ncbi:MAG: tetratricopeptide repeat protein [Planctomycetota bacterium]
MQDGRRRLIPFTPGTIAAVALAVALLVIGAYVVSPKANPEAIEAARLAEAQARQRAIDERVLQIGREIDAAARNGRDLSPMIADLRDVIADYPDHLDARRAIALAIGSRGDIPDEAYDHLTRTLDEEGDIAEMHAIAGNLSLQAGDPGIAVAHYRRAVALDPDEPRFLSQLAQAHMMAGQTDDALEVVDAWVERDSDQPQPFIFRARLLTEAGRLDDADGSLRQALDRSMPDETDMRLAIALNRAGLLRQLDRPVEAMGVLRMLSVDEQVTQPVADALAATWDQLDQPDKAALHYERIALMYPAATWAARAAADRYMALDEPEKADAMRTLLPR